MARPYPDTDSMDRAKSAKESAPWPLIESHLSPLFPPDNPQADLKEKVDLAEVLSQIDSERRDKYAHEAPQAWNPPTEAPIHVADEDGMQIDPGSAPELSPGQRHDGGSPTLLISTTSDSAQKDCEIPPARNPEEKILGLNKRVFWILFAFAVLLFLAAIGGTVGGILASKKPHTNNLRPVPTSTSTLTPIPLPTSKYRMSFTLQTWESTNRTGRSQIFYTEGLYRTGFRARSYSWAPGAYNDTNEWTVCTMALCQGDKRIGWWGATPHVGLGDNWMSNVGVDYGDVVNVKCARTFADPGCPLAATSLTLSFATVPIFDPGVATVASVGRPATARDTKTTTTSASKPSGFVAVTGKKS